MVQSDLLYNGVIYYKEYPNASGDSYFGMDAWEKSWLSIQGIIFADVEIKLDIVSDKLILNTINNEIIELNPLLVDSFKILDNIFVCDKDKRLSKYYLEKVYAGKTIFYKVHQKEFIKEYNSFTPFGKISDITTNRFLFSDEKEIKINTKRDFFNAYPDNKKDIKAFLKKNNIKYRKAANDELKKLMVFCEKL